MQSDYLIATDEIDADYLLGDWQWLIGNKPSQIVAIAAVGNLFLRGVSGRIYLLDIEDGTCESIADSVEEFKANLADRHNRRAWLQGFLVREMRRRGITLGAGECYGRKIPFVLGGRGGTPEDHAVIDLLAHVSTLGQLHRQIRELPPGTPIDEIRVKRPNTP